MEHPSTLIVAAPYDRRELASLRFTEAGEVDAWLEEAAGLHAGRETLPKWERLAILEKASCLLAARAEDFSQMIAREGGKPLMDARVETQRAVEGLVWAAQALRSEAGREVPMDRSPSTAGRRAHTHHEPIGPVVAISAFNHPLNLIVHQVAPAVAAGCPVIVKPALTTPLSCLALVRLLRKAGLPEKWCRVAIVNDGMAESLATDERVAFLSFIGSAKVGWRLRGRLAPGTRCALEHGGTAPVVVERDADLETAVPRLVKGGYYHAGQVCVSVQRIFVQEERADALLALLCEAVAALRVGDPEAEETEVGPLIRPREVRRVAEWVEEARGAGAGIALGGHMLGETLYAPTVVVNPPDRIRLSCEEIFGPVVAVIPCADWREAVKRANAVPWSFQAAVFTQDPARAEEIAGALDASGVMINDHTAFRADWMPFAGRRRSGLGVGGIPQTFGELRPAKLIVNRFG